MATSEQIAALIAYRGGDSSRDTELAEACVDQAVALVDQRIGSYIESVPGAIYEAAVLECGSKLWLRKSAPMGSDSYTDPEGNFQPIPRDPMVTTYPILDPFLGPGFA